MPETQPDFGQLIPPLGDELLADDALAAVSAVIPEIPDFTTVYEQPEPRAYGMTWVFDFNAGQFVTAGNGPARCWNYDALRMWCTTASQIDRGAHPIFDEDSGMDDSHAIIGSVRNDPSAQQQYMNDLAAALKQHDRITNVSNFEFSDTPPGTDPSLPGDPTADYVFVTFEITTDDHQVTEMQTVVGDG